MTCLPGGTRRESGLLKLWERTWVQVAGELYASRYRRGCEVENSCKVGLFEQDAHSSSFGRVLLRFGNLLEVSPQKPKPNADDSAIRRAALRMMRLRDAPSDCSRLVSLAHASSEREASAQSPVKCLDARYITTRKRRLLLLLCHPISLQR